MRIHIFGASGSGVTTLGRHLSQQLQYPYFDNDDFFWEKSDPPFTVRRAPELRNKLLSGNLIKTGGNYIVGGSMVSWGDEWLEAFDLAVFLYVPPQVRLDRLKKREYERYGDVIYHDPKRHQQFLGFIDWAASYDDPTSTRRSIGVHLDWMTKLKCELIRIDGVTSVEYRAKLVLAAVDNFKK